MQEELAGVAADALHLDAVVLHQQEHAERHAERDVDVGGRHEFEELQTRRVLAQRDHVHRQQIERVHQQDQAEDRDRKRCDQRVVNVKAVPDVGVDKMHDQLDEALEAAWRDVGATAGGARGNVETDYEQQPQTGGDQQTVDVQGPERTLAEVPVPIGQMVLDVFANGPG